MSKNSSQPAASSTTKSSAVQQNSWTRRERPCDACRRRKSRCIISDQSDACVLCQSRSEECTFVQSPLRRKRPRLETEAASPDAGRTKSPEVEPVKINARLPINDYDAMQEPTLLRHTLGLQNRQHGQLLKYTAENDARLSNLAPFDRKDEYASSTGVLRRVNPNTHFLMEAETQTIIDDELAKLDRIESLVAPHGQALIDLYFRIIHPSFPILHKKVFLEKYSRTYREFTPLVLAGVYILALHWWTYSPDLVNLPKPNVQELERLVPRLVGDAIGRPKLSIVQGGLLLLQRPDGDSWALTAEIIAVGQNLGLHLDCSDWRIPEWERSLRKRLGWALYMQDKWAALVNGRPTLILSDNWDVQPVAVRDFPETAFDENDEEGSSEVEKGRLVFVNMIPLTEILADILNVFYTVKAVKRNMSTLEALEKAKPLQMRLKEWFTSLPMSLSMDDTRARKLSSSGYLHLAYFATEITLHRAILRSLDSNNTDRELRAITRNAAAMRLTQAIKFVKALRPDHLQSFWYFASKSNLAIIGTFGSILWITSDDGEECDVYKSQLAEYRWTLRVSSQSAGFMKHTVAMLDASTVFLRALDPKIATPKGLLTSETTPKSIDPNEQRDLKAETSPVQHQTYEYGNYSQDSSLPTFGAYTHNNASEVSWGNSPQSGITYATATTNWHPGPYAYNFEGVPTGQQFMPDGSTGQSFEGGDNNFAEF